MAERRMFHATVVESDQFLDLPLSTQALYFHLGMHSDDDGFVNNPRRIARTVGARAADFHRLVDTGYLLIFDTIAVITHFRVANSLRSDRLHPLRHPDIAKKLYLSPVRVYSTNPTAGTNLAQYRQELLDSHGNPKIREEKRTEEKITEEKITEENPAEPGDTPEAAADAYEDPYYKKFISGSVKLTRQQMNLLMEKMGLDEFACYYNKLADYIQSKNATIKNHYATILRWWEEDRSV